MTSRSQRQALAIAAITFLFGIAAACSLSVADGASNYDDAFALKGVNVISVVDGSIARDKTILIRNGTIDSILDPGDVLDPRVTVIPLEGKFVLPGLCDCHAHLQTNAFYAMMGAERTVTLAEQEAALAVYLANGVTAIAVMSGADDLLALRDAIDEGRVIGPRLAVGSPMVDGEPPILPAPMTRLVLSADEAREIVSAYKAAGYDFLKVRNNLRLEAFDALADAAAKAGIAVIGHIPDHPALNLRRVFGHKGFGVAHVYELTRFPPYRKDDPSDLVRLLYESDAFVISTLSVHANLIARSRNFSTTSVQPGSEYVHPQILDFWRSFPFEPLSIDELERDLKSQQALIRLLIAAGVPVIAGTDAGSPTILPGYSIVDELRLLAQAGLSPLEVLQAATITPSQRFNRFANMGVVETGRSADLLVLDSNPLEDLDTLHMIAGIVVHGRWLDRADLNERSRHASEILDVQTPSGR